MLHVRCDLDYAVITCADAEFFHFLPVQEKNIERKFGFYPTIYDLGLTSDQKSRLLSPVVAITPPEGFDKNVPNGAIRASHKPSSILDHMEKTGENVLYIDADVLAMAPLPKNCFEGADVALTPRHPKEMRNRRPFKNGTINSGVLFFRNTGLVRNLLSHWQDRCAEGHETDQEALAHLLRNADLTGEWGDITVDGMDVRKLDARLYNDVELKTGYLWHFKNAGRSTRAKRRWWLAVLRDRFFAGAIQRGLAKKQSELIPLPPNGAHPNALKRQA